MRHDDESKGARFEQFVIRQSRFVFRVAFAVLRDSCVAEDVVQETFLKLYRSGAWEDLDNEQAFLARAAWRMAVDHLPKKERHAELFDVASDNDSPEDAAIKTDWSATVHRLMDALPEELRQVLALSGIEGMNSREIGAAIGVAEGTVRTRLMRAREILKQKLAMQRRTPCGK